MSSLAHGDYGSGKCEMYFNSSLNTLCLERRAKANRTLGDYALCGLGCVPVSVLSNLKGCSGVTRATRRATHLFTQETCTIFPYGFCVQWLEGRSIKWIRQCAQLVQIQCYFNIINNVRTFIATLATLIMDANVFFCHSFVSYWQIMFFFPARLKAMTIKCLAILQHCLENDLQYSIVNLKDYKHTHVTKATINNAKWKS